MAADDYAIVIGVRTYPYMNSLRGPCKDAEAFYDWLVDLDKGAVPKVNVKLLTTDQFPNPDSTDHPNLSDIYELFREFVTEGHQAVTSGPSFGRRLYIYIAGHGFAELGDMRAAALYAADAEPSFALHVVATEYANWFEYNGVFDEIVLVMDCCRTTSMTNQLTPPALPRTRGSPRRSRVRTFAAYAVVDGQQAREKETNGHWRGIFTTALLEALDLAVPNDRGEVRGNEVANYVHQAIGTIQAPDFDVNERRDIVFAERLHADGIAVSFHLDPFTRGETVVILDHSGGEATRTDPASPDFDLTLTAGYYKALIEGTPRKTLFEVPNDEKTIL